MRNTKIHATLGPASSSPVVLREMAEAGMDAARVNMSHSSEHQIRELARAIREVSRELGRPVAVGADLKGPKLRIGTMRGGTVSLRDGASFSLRSGEGTGSEEVAYVNYRYLLDDLVPGRVILLADGAIVLRSEQRRHDSVVCRVEKGGDLSSRKGISFPGLPLRTPSLTEKDLADMAAAVSAGVDFIYLSYARSAEHVDAVRSALRGLDSELPVVAKIERPDGADAMADIAMAADGVCIARGDLGIEIPLGAVPPIQEEGARLCRERARLSLLGGQVLSSMVSSPIPLRAEVADVATAVRDGYDGIILSDETSIGAYPVQSVRSCAQVLQRAEERWQARPGASWAVVVAPDGGPAEAIAASRQFAGVVAIVDDPSAASWLAGWWGIVPVLRGGRGQPARLAREALRHRMGERSENLDLSLLTEQDVARMGASFRASG